MGMPGAASVISEVFSAAGTLGRSVFRALGSGFRERVVGLLFSNLKLSLAVLLTGLGFVVAMVALPVLLLVFAMSVGVSHGLRLDAPAAEAAGPPLAAGQLACPVPGAVTTQPFGPSALPGEPALFGFRHFHAGVDLGIGEGTPIRAAEGGQVLQAAGQADSLGFLVGYGNLVRIAAAGGRVDYYGHMSAFNVERGDIVQQGEVIGFVGTTGYSTGPHLHFEVRLNGTPVDPAPFMRSC